MRREEVGIESSALSEERKAGDKDLSRELIRAVREKNIEQISSILTKGANINESRDTNGLNPLLIAARIGDRQIVEYLLEKGSNCLENAGAPDGKRERRNPGTALHQATLYGHLDVMEYLISKESKLVNMGDGHDITPLFWACSPDHEGRTDLAEALIKHGAHVNILNDTGASPLSYAAINVSQYKHSIELGQYLLKYTDPIIVYKSCRRVPLGMYKILHGLRFISVDESSKVQFETTLLYPGEVSYNLSGESSEARISLIDEEYENVLKRNFAQLGIDSSALSTKDEEDVRELKALNRKKVLQEDIARRFGQNSTHFHLQYRNKWEKWIYKHWPTFTNVPFDTQKNPDLPPIAPNGWEKLPWYSVTELLVPMPFPTNMKLLLSFVYISERVGNPELFNNEVLQAIVDCAWITRGRKYHLFHIFAYLVLLLMVWITNYTYHDWIQIGDETQKSGSNAMLWIMFAANTILAVSELIALMYAVIQSFTKRNIYGEKISFLCWNYAECKDDDKTSMAGRYDMTMLLRYFGINNFLDWILYVLIYIGIFIRWINKGETQTSAAIMTMANLFLVAKGFHHMRPFRVFGSFIRICYLCFSSIKELILVLFLLILGFSQALYVLSYEHPYNDDVTDATPNYLSRPLYSMAYFFIFLYQPDLAETHNTSNPALATFVYCLFTFFGSLVILNLLIALLNAKFDDLQLTATADLYREQARIMVENRGLCSIFENLFTVSKSIKRAGANTLLRAGVHTHLRETNKIMRVLMRKAERDEKIDNFAQQDNQLLRKFDGNFKSINDSLKKMEETIKNISAQQIGRNPFS